MTEREKDVQAMVAAMHPASWWRRLPIIRHIRAVRVTIAINRHYAMWERVGMLPVNADFDYAMRDAIWRGEK